MQTNTFDPAGRFIIANFAAARPFASFLPGIAGPLGTPLWVFYVNRGQAIASFGIENKDHPIMEFLPANKAYQSTPYTGFRTFLKLTRDGATTFYEPFAPWQTDDATQMFIGMNELELQTASSAHNIQTNVLYFTLPGEDFAGLVRQVTFTNIGATPVIMEALDGMAYVQPYGVDNWGLKEIGRTLEAWMGVFNMERGIPFYRFQASAGDTAEVAEIQAGHFYLAFGDDGALLPMFVDPAVVFGTNTTLSAPNGFLAHPLDALRAQRQITVGRTPCGFCGTQATLKPGQSLTLNAIIGHVRDIGHIHRQQARLTQPAYLREKRAEGNRLVEHLTDVVATRTADPTFDAYCRQTFLDNVMRGGWPVILGSEERPFVYHIYSRKHGDLERDYNAFFLAAERYSQGNGNYRDVNQNRRCDVWFNPQVGDFNVLSFLELIQIDGYNPLVVNGSRFTLPPDARDAVLALADDPAKLAPLLARPFTPGGLLKAIADRHIGLTVAPETFITAALTHAEQHFEATFGEGYWIDHWFYNLDLIDSYLAIYPDRKRALLFDTTLPYFDSPVFVQPRSKKYVLAGEGKVRQYGAILEDEEKAALIAARATTPNLLRTAHGHGDVYRATVFAKLLTLALTKFASLDPWGMGIEMEAGKPGWCDALNGLPGLFGSSLCETLELVRLLGFLLQTMSEFPDEKVAIPREQSALLDALLQAYRQWAQSKDADREYVYWDAVATARETYREQVRFGIDGETVIIAFNVLLPALVAFSGKIEAGIHRALALNNGLPPTYFAYTVTDYTVLDDTDPQGRPYVKAKHFEPRVLPLYLEGIVHTLKLVTDPEEARALHARVKAGDLYDRKLGMYKVNASLANETHEIGRARAFTPGWLENESIWLHMEYKYLLELLRAGLYEEFFADAKTALVPFLDPAVYGRSPLENASFLVSSAHPDATLHGGGFVARLSGSTAEFLSMWNVMFFGAQPFFVQDGALHLAPKPALPGWLFDAAGTVTATFLGRCPVTYHNPHKRNTFAADAQPRAITLHLANDDTVTIDGAIIGPPYAAQVRDGQISRIDVYFEGVRSME
ncbi:MAG TPA: cellobiose phosphorylase [Anaerolineae bacterium]|nr:cellobiose phosphorylase [Anaerolineae bacterium]